MTDRDTHRQNNQNKKGTHEADLDRAFGYRLRRGAPPIRPKSHMIPTPTA